LIDWNESKILIQERVELDEIRFCY